AGAFGVLADGTDHDPRNREGGVDGFLAGLGLDEVRAGHHGDDGGAGYVAEGEQVAGAEDGFHVGGPAGFLEGGDLVVEGVPLAVEDVGAGDDDIDLAGAGFDGAADLLDARFERREPGGEAGGDGGDRDSGAFESLDGGFDEEVVDADGADVEVEGLDAEGADEMVFERAARFGAEALDALGGVVAGEGGEVHAREGAEEPGGLEVLFDGAAGADGGGAALYGRGVDADLFDPGEVERDAAVGRERAAVEGDGDGGAGGVGGLVC